mmetsp:Transcript_31809/g.101477  ORF Transcript_31809/g.101477 Transcript_31809/m.101477 type:complete len:218 (-) Transcript_31809:1129-1782(-)
MLLGQASEVTPVRPDLLDGRVGVRAERVAHDLVPPAVCAPVLDRLARATAQHVVHAHRLLVDRRGEADPHAGHDAVWREPAVVVDAGPAEAEVEVGEALPVVDHLAHHWQEPFDADLGLRVRHPILGPVVAVVPAVEVALGHCGPCGVRLGEHLDACPVLFVEQVGQPRHVAGRRVVCQALHRVAVPQFVRVSRVVEHILPKVVSVYLSLRRQSHRP